MRHLLNTLFVLTPESYLMLDGENIVLKNKEDTSKRFPLHIFENIISFSYAGASPALMGACVKKGIGLSFFTPWGKFLARISGEISGNVLLRQEQYRISDDKSKSIGYAKNFLLGKIYNGRWVLERATRDHPQRVPVKALKLLSSQLSDSLKQISQCQDLEQLLGLEGAAAQSYFSGIDSLILRNKKNFFFRERSRRPPLDNVNAMLSFTYVLLSIDCASALQSVGLDPYVGFMHRPRPGRRGLALDLMEELRAVFADRFVLSCINQNIMTEDLFKKQESGAVEMTDKGRRVFLTNWQKRKQEEIRHPFLKEKIPWGMVPYIQALLLARTVRGDLSSYPPFFWK